MLSGSYLEVVGGGEKMSGEVKETPRRSFSIVELRGSGENWRS